MQAQPISIKDLLNKAYFKLQQTRSQFGTFKGSFVLLLNNVKSGESGEHHKNKLYEFLKNENYVQSHSLNTKGRYDLVVRDGKDGWLDIIAFNDPLGATAPRLKVQVKHKPDSNIPVDDIRSLTGLLNRDGDIGLFVTTGYFISDVERSARESHRHIKLLDIDSFIALWQEFYSKMTDEDKILLPLHPIYFLGNNG